MPYRNILYLPSRLVEASVNAKFLVLRSARMDGLVIRTLHLTIFGISPFHAA